MTRKVLLICYYFPPLGLAGVTRPLNLFRYLPQHGWNCHVLTVKPVAYRGYEPELLEGLDRSKIFRAGSRDPQRLLYLLGVRHVRGKTIERSAQVKDRFFPDSKIGWVRPAVRLGTKLIKEHKYDIILSTSPPISGHLVGMRLHRRTGVPWVADFRDHWTVYPPEGSYRSEAIAHRAHELLRQFHSDAAAMVAVNEPIANFLGSADVIPNGYDPDPAALWRAPKRRDSYVIGCLGTFNQYRPIAPLFDLLRRLRSCDARAYDASRVLQVGNVDSAWLHEMIDRYDLTGRVEACGLLARDETVRRFNDAALFYLGADLKEGKGWTSGRVYQILASGRPLLAYAAPDSDIARLLRDTGNGYRFDEATVDQAVTYLRGQILGFCGGDLSIEPRPAYAAPYAWDKLAGRFASLFERLT